MIPAQEVSAFPPGTPEWAQWQLRNVFDPGDARAVTDLLAAGLTSNPYTWHARTEYAKLCHDRRWQGWQARLAWACIEALLIKDDDIPF